MEKILKNLTIRKMIPVLVYAAFIATFLWLSFSIYRHFVSIPGKIEKYRDEGNVEGIMTISRNEEGASPFAVIDALKQIGSEAAVAGIAEHLNRGSEAANYAAKTLGELGSTNATEALLQAINLSDYPGKQSVIALNKIRDPTCVEILVNGIKSTDTNDRRIYLTKAALIAALSVETAERDFNYKVTDVDEWMRKLMIDNLRKEKLYPKDELFQLTTDDDIYVTSGAVWLLWELRPDVKEEEYILAHVEHNIRGWLASKRGDQLRNNWQVVKKILMSDVLSNDQDRIHKALTYFMGIGNKTIIPVLVDALQMQGNKKMAEAYLNAGHQTLADEARNWARKNGYTITIGQGHHPVNWGSW